MPSTLLVVLASGYDEFRRWCQGSGLSPRDPDVVFVDRWDRLRGLTDVKIIRCPRWYAHPDADRIEQAVHSIEQRRPAQIQVQPDPPHVAEAIRDIRRFGTPPHRP
ncbi:hypothetical protein ACFY78_36690 [Streptomyces olindensis]|uniref:hypothetical protein n=1 Tax=Streptomyces olindensis TaxID=358823 RepID=UPI0036B5BF30